MVFPGSVCRQHFVGVTVGELDVKSLVECDGEGYIEVLKVYCFCVFVMYYVYVTPGPYLLIKSTDPMILVSITFKSCMKGCWNAIRFQSNSKRQKCRYVWMQ